VFDRGLYVTDPRIPSVYEPFKRSTFSRMITPMNSPCRVGSESAQPFFRSGGQSHRGVASSGTAAAALSSGRGDRLAQCDAFSVVVQPMTSPPAAAAGGVALGGGGSDMSAVETSGGADLLSGGGSDSAAAVAADGSSRIVGSEDRGATAAASVTGGVSAGCGTSPGAPTPIADAPPASPGIGNGTGTSSEDDGDACMGAADVDDATRAEATRRLMLRWRIPGLSVHFVGTSMSNSSVIPARATGE
jgi:hypothetical protein